MLRFRDAVGARLARNPAPKTMAFASGAMLFVLVGLWLPQVEPVSRLINRDSFPPVTGLSIAPSPEGIWEGKELVSQSFREADAGGHVSESAQDLDIERFQQLSFTEHTVSAGETITGIAQQHGIRMDTLVSFNQISDSRRVQIGTEFKVPSRDGLRHIVERGDTLEGVASEYGVEVNDILDANDLSTDTLSPGQELFVPGATMDPGELRIILGEAFVYPVRGRLTSGFGYRNDPFTGRRSFHNGVDWAAPVGTPVGAAMAGRVVDTGRNSVYGRYVVIQHPRGYQTLYAHLSQIIVQTNQRVGQRQRIGRVGNTGRSTGPHLHFSIFRNGQPINPLRELH